MKNKVKGGREETGREGTVDEEDEGLGLRVDIRVWQPRVRIEPVATLGFDVVGGEGVRGLGRLDGPRIELELERVYEGRQTNASHSKTNENIKIRQMKKE